MRHVPRAVIAQGGVVHVFWRAGSSILTKRVGVTAIRTVATNAGSTATPAVASKAAGQFDVVYATTSSSIGVVTLTATSVSAAVNLGVAVTSDPTVTSRRDGLLDVVVRGSDWRMYHAEYTSGTWSSFAPFGAGFHSGPVLVKTSSSRAYLIAVGANYSLTTSRYTR
jgi:hypothetical protein